MFVPDDLVHCSLCLEVFTQPKALPCIHTFCLKCLQRYIDTNNFVSKLVCPLCKASTVIPENDVNQFPNNFLVANLVQNLQQAKPENKKDKSHECHSCDSICHGNDFCNTCQMWLGQDCSKVHKRLSFPTTAKHEIINKAKCKERQSLVSDLKQKIEVKISNLLVESQRVTERQRQLTTQILSAADRFRKCIDDQERLLLDKVNTFHEESKQRIDRLILEAGEQSVKVDMMEKRIKNIQDVFDGQQNSQRVRELEDFWSSKMENLKDILSDKSNRCQNFEMFEHNFTNLETMEIGQMREEREILFVQCPDGHTVSVLLSPNESVKVLKEKLEILTKIKPIWQVLSLDDVTLADDTKVSDLGIGGYHNVIKLSEVPERQVSVKLPGEKTVQLTVTPTDTVGQLKDKLDHQTGPPTYGRVVMFEDNTLKYNKKVVELDLSKDKVISVKDLTGPELTDYVKVGTRVKRGIHWDLGAEKERTDGSGTATVTQLNINGNKGLVGVKWDDGIEYWYFVGYNDKFHLRLA